MAEGNWHSTLFFRNFRKKHTNLSQLYWTSQLGHEALKAALAAQPQEEYAVDVLGASFGRAMLPEKVGSLLNTLESRAGIERLHLLVICSANLEAYLQDVTKLYIAAQGHQKTRGKLTLIGEALARPIVQSSDLPNMIKYAQDLYDIRFGPHLNRWQRAYKLRCAAAHNGGIVTAKVKRAVPDIGLNQGDRITLDWPLLMSYLESADEIATTIDRKSSTDTVRQLEIEWLLHEWKVNKVLPPRSSVWTELHKLGFAAIPKSVRLRLEAEFYTTPEIE